MSVIPARVHERITLLNEAQFKALLESYLAEDHIQPGHQEGTAEVTEIPTVVRFSGCLVVTAAYRHGMFGGVSRGSLQRVHHLHRLLHAALFEPDELARVGFWTQTDPTAIVTLTALGGGMQEVRFFDTEWRKTGQISPFFQLLYQEHHVDANVVVVEAAFAQDMLGLGFTPKEFQCFLVQIFADGVAVIENFLPIFVHRHT